MAASKNPLAYPQVYWDIMMKMRELGPGGRVPIKHETYKAARAMRSRWFYFRTALTEQERQGFFVGEGTFATSITASLMPHPDGSATLLFCFVADDPAYASLRAQVAAVRAPTPSAEQSAPHFEAPLTTSLPGVPSGTPNEVLRKLGYFNPTPDKPKEPQSE